MATFDQLTDEQRAIVELVLRQGKSYEELADMLGIPEQRVRERAREALVDLAPVSVRGVEEDWRGQLADYVLGQQAGPEATATRGHLRRSDAARGWVRSLLDSLEQLYPDGELPVIPEAERGARRAAAPRSEGGPLAASPEVRRRRLMAALGAAALVLLVAVLLWPIGVLTGDDDDGGDAGNAAASPIDTDRLGSAIVARQQGKTQILVQAQGLQPTTEKSVYQVWLYDSASKRKSLGPVTTNNEGNMQVFGQMPSDYRDYGFVDVTTAAVVGSGENQRLRPGRSVLRGQLKLSAEPIQTGTGENRATVLAQISLRPLPG